MGITLELLSFVGKVPLSKDWLKIMLNGSTIALIDVFKNWEGIPSMPTAVDLVVVVILLPVCTSFEVVNFYQVSHMLPLF